MSDRIKIAEGDCIETIGAQHGRSPARLWSNNPDLAGMRRSGNVLAPGDEVQIPAADPKTVAATSNAVHRFVRPQSTTLRIYAHGDATLLGSPGQPPALRELPYELRFEGGTRTGVTDSTGFVECTLPCSVTEATLRVGAPPNDVWVYRLQLGSLRPEDLAEGVQARLFNLGYNVGAVDGVLGERSQAAIESFQRRQGLDVTGQSDAQVEDALIDAHGS